MALGVNWYAAFDEPTRSADGRWWVGRGALGKLRGGHCVCVPDQHHRDLLSWRLFYNQRSEGACVGFGSSRMKSLLDRRLYNPWWLWDLAKMGDAFSDTNAGDDEGTTVRAAMEVLRLAGHVRWKRAHALLGYRDRDSLVPRSDDGIAAYRWATSADEVLAALGSPLYERVGAVPIANSWGLGYPLKVWLPLETLDRLIQEDGEAAIVTDL